MLLVSGQLTSASGCMQKLDLQVMRVQKHRVMVRNLRCLQIKLRSRGGAPLNNRLLTWHLHIPVHGVVSPFRLPAVHDTVGVSQECC